MRKKPEYSDVSDEAWDKFCELADGEGIGEKKEDWFIFFLFFEKGYIAKWEE